MDEDWEYLGTKGVSDDGGWGFLELRTSGWTSRRTVRDNATRYKDAAAHESHSTEVSGFIFRAYNTSAWNCRTMEGYTTSRDAELEVVSQS